MTLYRKIFENVLDEPQIDPQQDSQSFAQGFDNDNDFNQIEQETQDISLSEEEIESITRKSKIYNEKISSFIFLLNNIQEDVLKGQYRNIKAKGLDKFANIIKDLQELGTDLTAGVNDALIKKSNDSQ